MKTTILFLVTTLFLAILENKCLAHAPAAWPSKSMFVANAPCPPETCCKAGGAGGSGGASNGGTACSSCGVGSGGGDMQPVSAVGMPVWAVSEPELNLWLLDRPMGYVPQVGPPVQLDLLYKDFGGTLDHFSSFDINVFSIGWGWHLNFRSYVEANPDTTDQNVDLFTQDGRATTYNTNGVALEYSTQTKMQWDGTQYILTYPTGAKDYFALGTDGVNQSNGNLLKRYFLTKRQDPFGTFLTFEYTTNSLVKLTKIKDAKNRETGFVYYDPTNSPYFGALVWKITNEFSQSVEFKYSSDGCLTNIIDAAGIDSRMTYDTDRNLTSLITPYGTTSFEYHGPNGVLARRVIEPNGAKHLYLYRNSFTNSAGTPLLSTTYSDRPSTTNSSYFSLPNTFENANMHQYNSLYWGPRQYPLLSATVQNNLATNFSSFYTNITSGDYAIGRLRHWLQSASGKVGVTLSMERDVSPDGATDGQTVWYDYDSKTGTDSEIEGSMVWPKFKALKLPNGESSLSYFSRNSLGKPTMEVQSYSDSANIWRVRTNSNTYSTDGIDLLIRTNASGIRVVSNSYISGHLLSARYNAIGELTTYTYNTDGQNIWIKRPTGLITTNVYMSSGTYSGWLDKRIDYEDMGGGTYTSYGTNSYSYTNGYIRTHTDALGLAVTYYRDGLLRLIGTSDTRGATTNLYNKLDGAFPNSSGAVGLLDVTAAQDRLGQWTYFTRNSIRLLTSTTNANSKVTNYDYCDCGSLNSISNAVGEVTSYAYDNLGRLIRTTLSGASLIITNTYDRAGRLIVVSDGFGSVTNTFNNQGLITAINNAKGQVSGTTFDILDRPIETLDSNGAKVALTYDNVDRTSSTTVAGFGTNSFAYNSRGMTAHTNALNKAILCYYDAAQRKRYETNANNELLQYTYDYGGHLLTITDGRNKTTSWNYDTYGRATNKVDALNQVLFKYSYDANDRLTNRWTPAKGNTIYKFDSVGNLTNVIYNSSVALAYTYDAVNRLTNMTDSVGTSSFGYTDGLLSSEDGPWDDDKLTYSYDKRLRQWISLAQPGQAPWTVLYAYDTVRRLTNVISSAGTFSYSYHPGLNGLTASPSLVHQITLPGNSIITNTYDNSARIVSTALKASTGTTLNSHVYGYNNANQRTNHTRVDGSVINYAYDDAGQLRSAVGKESGGTSRLNEQFGYSYDASGNLLYRTNNALIQNFSVDSVNELTNVTRSGTLTVSGTSGVLASNVTVNGSSANRYSDATFALAGFTLTNGINSYTAVGTDAAGRSSSHTVTVNLPSLVSPTYDGNGNLLTDGRRTLAHSDNAVLQKTAVEQLERRRKAAE